MSLSRLPSIASFFARTSLALVGGACLLHAASPGASSAAPAAHTHDPVALDQFVTSATPFPRNQVDLAQSTTVLSGRPLLLRQQATLGETLASETGIHASSYGPGASRPVIRGLDGERILILENGTALLDASSVSPDHAVSVEPFLVERIEAVRGPASLLYGSTAVGGVVNVISHRIETELRDERVRGGAEARYDSAARGFARGGVLDLKLLGGQNHALVLHLDGFRRDGKDVRIPGYAESATVRQEEAEEVHSSEYGTLLQRVRTPGVMGKSGTSPGRDRSSRISQEEIRLDSNSPVSPSSDLLGGSPKQAWTEPALELS